MSLVAELQDRYTSARVAYIELIGRIMNGETLAVKQAEKVIDAAGKSVEEFTLELKQKLEYRRNVASEDVRLCQGRINDRQRLFHDIAAVENQVESLRKGLLPIGTPLFWSGLPVTQGTQAGDVASGERFLASLKERAKLPQYDESSANESLKAANEKLASVESIYANNLGE